LFDLVDGIVDGFEIELFDIIDSVPLCLSGERFISSSTLLGPGWCVILQQ